jgi:hypothetical protein
MNGVIVCYCVEFSLVFKNGDWYFDDEVLIFIMWDEDGIGKFDDLIFVIYYYYEGVIFVEVIFFEEKYIYFVGDCKFGDFVIFDC